jgi:hypothetical protein
MSYFSDFFAQRDPTVFFGILLETTHFIFPCATRRICVAQLKRRALRKAVDDSLTMALI